MTRALSALAAMAQQFFHYSLQGLSEVMIHLSFACMLDDHRAHALKTHVYQMAGFAEQRFLRRACVVLASGRIRRGTYRPIRDSLVRFLRKEEHELTRRG